MGKAFDIGLNQLAAMSGETGASDEKTRNLMIRGGCGTQDGGAQALAGQAGAVPQKAGQTFYLETFGCQMNEHDSEKVAGVLLARGYRQVEKADAADVVLYNTCSIREKAAQKVFSRLGELRPVDWARSGSVRIQLDREAIPQGLAPHEGAAGRRKDRPIIGVLGCLA